MSKIPSDHWLNAAVDHPTAPPATSAGAIAERHRRWAELADFVSTAHVDLDERKHLFAAAVPGPSTRPA